MNKIVLKTGNSSNKLRNIAISKDNYNILRELGKTGDTFNSVLTNILQKSGSSKKLVDSNLPESEGL